MLRPLPEDEKDFDEFWSRAVCWACWRSADAYCGLCDETYCITHWTADDRRHDIDEYDSGKQFLRDYRLYFRRATDGDR